MTPRRSRFGTRYRYTQITKFSTGLSRQEWLFSTTKKNGYRVLYQYRHCTIFQFVYPLFVLVPVQVHLYRQYHAWDPGAGYADPGISRILHAPCMQDPRDPAARARIAPDCTVEIAILERACPYLPKTIGFSPGVFAVFLQEHHSFDLPAVQHRTVLYSMGWLQYQGGSKLDVFIFNTDRHVVVLYGCVLLQY